MDINKETVTRFALKVKDRYYIKNGFYGRDIHSAQLYKDKPITKPSEKVVMISVTYEEMPYEVKQ